MDDDLKCECCGATEEQDSLRAVGPIMGGKPFGQETRAICSTCFGIWYETGICSPADIGVLRLRGNPLVQKLVVCDADGINGDWKDAEDSP